MRNYLISCFHILIIASLGFNFIGCGYKAPPVYKSQTNSTKTLK